MSLNTDANPTADAAAFVAEMLAKVETIADEVREGIREDDWKGVWIALHDMKRKAERAMAVAENPEAADVAFARWDEECASL